MQVWSGRLGNRYEKGFFEQLKYIFLFEIGIECGEVCGYRR
jgi:hypothetical protein